MPSSPKPKPYDELQDLRSALIIKYRENRVSVRRIWHAMDADLRVRALKAGATEGAVLRFPTDRSLGQVCDIVPDWNLLELADPRSDLLLDMFEYRTTATLYQQYRAGLRAGIPGDAAVIFHSMKMRGLRPRDAYPNCLSLFYDNPEYGMWIKAEDDAAYKEAMTVGLVEDVHAGLVVPQSVGELIKQRQATILSLLSIVIGTIMNLGCALPSPAAQQKNKPSALYTCQDFGSVFEDKMLLLRTNPAILAHELDVFMSTRPELVKDEKGRIEGKRDLSSAIFFDMMHSSIIAAASWSYICALVALVDKTGADDDHARRFRADVMQHLANAIQTEYVRAQTQFKRALQTGSGARFFRRVSNVFDASVPRVNQKASPDSLMAEDPQLCYLLRICNPKTGGTPAKSAVWVDKLDEIHCAKAATRARIAGPELDALSHLALIVGFARSYTDALSLPPASQAKAQLYNTKAKGLAAALVARAKPHLDLSAYAVPADKLLDPEMAKAALVEFNRVLSEKTGLPMETLYLYLVETCVTHLLEARQRDQADEPAGTGSAQPDQTQIIEELRKKKKKPATRADDQQKASTAAEVAKPTGEAATTLEADKPAEEATTTSEPAEPAEEAATTPEATKPTEETVAAPEADTTTEATKLVEEAATAPEAAATTEVATTPDDDKPADVAEPAEEAAATPEAPANVGQQAERIVVDVRPGTHDLLLSLVGRVDPQPVAWLAFQRAMFDMDFWALPRPGAWVTFVPLPADAPATKGPMDRPVTLQIPCGAEVEGLELATLALRLRRAYGWGPTSFSLGK